jgi:hypothetical protein
MNGGGSRWLGGAGVNERLLEHHKEDNEARRTRTKRQRAETESECVDEARRAGDQEKASGGATSFFLRTQRDGRWGMQRGGRGLSSGRVIGRGRRRPPSGLHRTACWLAILK